MRTFLFLFILLQSLNLFSQESDKVDSLEHELFKLEQRINTLEILITKPAGREPAMSGMELENSIDDSPGPEQNNLINHSLWLSISILVFGILIIAGAIFIMIKLRKGWGPNAIQVVGIILIVISSIFLITAGYSEKQITPVIGLLGTIAGYLLGKTNNESRKKTNADL